MAAPKKPAKKKSTRKNEQTSTKIGKIAAKGLSNPDSLTPAQIRALSGSVLTQRPDKSKKK